VSQFDEHILNLKFTPYYLKWDSKLSQLLKMAFLDKKNSTCNVKCPTCHWNDETFFFCQTSELYQRSKKFGLIAHNVVITMLSSTPHHTVISSHTKLFFPTYYSIILRLVSLLLHFGHRFGRKVSGCFVTILALVKCIIFFCQHESSKSLGAIFFSRNDILVAMKSHSNREI